MILMYQYSCRPWATPPLMGKKDLQEKLDIPILVVEGDSYDTRNYSAGQLRTRIESFAEILKMGKKAKAA
ncbi:MAG: 2-hydroxyacyl-CoA dehydratase [Deltaproteobacteria bacterium]|nr:2-hydroxyacyl-CoA dehydratase [Deltaproteobacteria bacterium]